MRRLKGKRCKKPFYIPTATGSLKTGMEGRAHFRRVNRLKMNIIKWDRLVLVATPPFRQLQHLVKKFGGIAPFAVAAGEHPDKIIKEWLLVGLVPSINFPKLIVTARHFGVLLLPEDIYPDFLGNTRIDIGDLKRWMSTIKKTDRQKEFEHDLASSV